MKNKDIIKDFLKKMAKQNNRGTAAPYFYVIRTEIEAQADPDNCDEVKYYDPDNCEHTYDTKEECRKELEEEGSGYTLEEVNRIVNRLERYGIRKEWKHKGMFLTEDDAKMHLKLNHYHYSSNAHIYVDHAWRAPELEGFFKALFKEYKVDKGNLDLRLED